MKQYITTGLIALAAGISGAYLFDWLRESPDRQSLQQKPLLSQAHYQHAVALSKSSSLALPDFIKASAISTPSVVYIRSVTSYKRSWMNMFFYEDSYQKKDIGGSGSGVIFSQDGYIVTNHHVIEGTEELEVVHNKKVYEAQIIGTDPSTDLALIKIHGEKLPAVRIASSSRVKVGQWVLAVGNPFNLTSTVTAGIVSAKGRRINILEDIFPIESFIQTDAAINPGNSGGALVDLDGELVGINTAILSKTGSYAGYGFAIPSDIVSKVFNDLKVYGEVQKAFIGVEVIDIDEEIYRKLELNTLDGVIVKTVQQGGMAQRVGIQVGDVIVQIDNNPIKSQSDFDEILSYHRPGDKVTIKYLNKTNIEKKEITLTNVEGTTSILKKEVFEAKRIGANLETVPKLELSKLEIKNGVRIKKVKRGGLIEYMELDEGFIIVAINNYPIESPEELTRILERIKGRVIIEGINKEGKWKYYPYYF